MRGSQLLGRPVTTRGGEDVGTVVDVRLAHGDGPPTVTELVVGRIRLATRLGYLHGEARGPWLLRRLVERAARDAWLVDIDVVDGLEDDVLTVDGRALRQVADRSSHPEQEQ